MLDKLQLAFKSKSVDQLKLQVISMFTSTEIEDENEGAGVERERGSPEEKIPSSEEKIPSEEKKSNDEQDEARRDETIRWEKLHDPWWQNAILSMAGCMDHDLFEAFAKILISLDDASGANITLCSQMLSEMSDRKFPNGKEHILEMFTKGFAAHRKQTDLSNALVHPSHHLRFFLDFGVLLAMFILLVITIGY